MNTYDGLTNVDASILLSISEMSESERVSAVRIYIDDKDQAARIISALIGMGNSLVENTRECVEIFAITGQNLLHPHNAGKLNLPTVQGAFMGIALASAANQNAKPCNTCAFRKGSPANQSTCTTTDAIDCISEGDDEFYCHEDMDGETPTKLCTGFATFEKRDK